MAKAVREKDDAAGTLCNEDVVLSDASRPTMDVRLSFNKKRTRKKRERKNGGAKNTTQSTAHTTTRKIAHKNRDSNLGTVINQSNESNQLTLLSKTEVQSTMGR